MKPTLVERFSDNGVHSHFDLIDSETGETLWSEDDETKEELEKENRHLSIQLKEAHEVIGDYQNVLRINDKEIIDLNVKLVTIKDKTRGLYIQHQQLLDKAIDDGITDEDTDGYKESIAILDELRNLIN